jgi:arsenate reductase
MSATIYHNPRCSKSRQALAILEEKGVELTIIEYLKDGLDQREVLDLARKLNMGVSQFIRSKEAEYKNYQIDWENNKEAAIVLSECPKLLERPIVVVGEKAVIARPPEEVEKLFC